MIFCSSKLFQVFFFFFYSQNNPKPIINLGEGQAVTVPSEFENWNRSFSIPILKSGLIWLILNIVEFWVC